MLGSMKRMLCGFLIALCLALLGWSIAYADDYTPAQKEEVLQQASTLLEATIHEEGYQEGYVLPTIDGQPVYLGNPIKAYTYQDGAYHLESIECWPLFMDGEAIATVTTILNDDGASHFLLSSGPVESLVNALMKSDEVAMVYDDEDLEVFITPEDALATDGEEGLSQIQFTAEIWSDISADPSNQLTYDPDAVYELDTQKEFEGVADSIVVEEGPGSQSVNESLELADSSDGIELYAQKVGSFNYLLVPTTDQGSTPTCWAYAVASIGQYMTTHWLSPRNIYARLGLSWAEEAGSLEQTQSALSLFWYPNSSTPIRSTIVWGGLTDTAVKRWISNGAPIYARLVTKGSAHGVVIRGYNMPLGKSFSVSIMNPGYGRYEMLLKNQDGVLGFMYAGRYFTWGQSITLTGFQMPESNKSSWYYFLNNGTVARGWLKDNGFWYYFNNSGLMTTNRWIKHTNGYWYYVGATGEMATNCWIHTGGYWYYVNGSGEMLTNSWIKHNGYWYYVNSNGEMMTGWIRYNGDWYALSSTGEMLTGWVKHNGSWYYCRTAENVPKAGREGAMLKNCTCRIDGKLYRFNLSGKCLNPYI